MKIKLLFIVSSITLLMSGCSLQDFDSGELTAKVEDTNVLELSESRPGAVQVSGIGVFADPETCDYESEGAYFALALSGDLEGCLFVYVDEYKCMPSGTYFESGREHFIGTYRGEEGSFWTTYNFEAKYEDCPGLVKEIFGRCQHPLVAGSGEGAFEGVTGRIDFKDDVETGIFYMRGHFRS